MTKEGEKKKSEALGLRDPFKLEAKVGAFQNRIDWISTRPLHFRSHPRPPRTPQTDLVKLGWATQAAGWMLLVLLLTYVFLSQA